MLGNIQSFAPSAARNPFGAAAVRVQAVPPVEARESPPPSSPQTPAARRQDNASTYTPSTKSAPGDAVYTRKGTLFSVERQDSFDLKIKTAEGDIATLSLSQHQSYSASGTSVTSQQGTTETLDVSASTALDVHISVKGELNAQETASINALVKQVSAVAGDFFAGDTQQAAKEAQRIDIRTQADTLSAFSFDLQSHEVQKAVAVYEGVANASMPLKPPVSPQKPAAQDTPAPNTGNDFLKQLLALFDGLTQQNTDVAQTTSGAQKVQPLIPAA